MGKQKRRSVAHTEQSTEHKHNLLDNDGDQEISDDGEIPVYEPGADSDEEMGDASRADDSEDDGDQSDEEADLNVQDAKASASSKPNGVSSTWKAPTTEELANIKAASELFKSNAFKLKIEALLPQVRPKATAKPIIESFLLALHEHLRALPSIEPQPPVQAFKKLQQKGVRVLLTQPEPTKATNWKVAFEPPSAIQLVGSWPHQWSVNSRARFCVDLALEMPASLFQEKDYLDSRFFHKRAYFLAVVASSLRKSDLGVEVDYEIPDDNVRRSALLVTPVKGHHASKRLNYSVRIILALPTDSPILLSRLSPTHSNIRNSDEPAPSPRYNNDVLLNTTPMAHLLLLHALSNEVPAARNALALVRVWANQRGFGPDNEQTISGFGSLVGSWWSFLLAYLVWGDEESSLSTAGRRRKGRRTLGKGLSSYQLFRAVLDLLASHNFVTEPIRVRLPSGKEHTTFDLSGHENPTFVGPSSPFNFLLDVPVSSLDLLRHDARCTLQALDSPSVSDGFDAVFLRDQRDLPQRFDTIIRVDLTSVNQGLFVDRSSPTAGLIVKLDSVLRRALGTRVRHFAIIQSVSHPSATFYPSPISSMDRHFVVQVGLILDPENAPKLVEHGPPAEDPEGCEQFRQFWGEKSELRRFNDGRIVESVVWDLSGKVSNERFQIPGRIVRYIVQRHLKVPEESITIFDSKYDGLLSIPSDITTRYSAPDTGSTPEASQRMALTAFDNLVKDIKAIDSLPLGLVNAVPVDEGLRYTSVFPPMPLASKPLLSLPDSVKYIPVIDIILQFEQSTRWPDDLGAIQKVKIALFDAIAQVLIAKGSPHAVIAWDPDAADRPLEDHVSLEVMLSSGFAFRARVQHDRERTLMERIISDKRETPDYERKRAQLALERHTRRFISAPAHHAAVLALQRKYPSYSHAVRLFKRWLSSHWLAPHVSLEAAELICAELYLNPSVHEAPCSGQAGFARALALLAHWDFREDPLAIPLYSASSAVESKERISMSSETLKEARGEFVANLAIDPGLSNGAWTLVTEQDPSGRMWTRGITSLLANRARELAKATLDYINHSIPSGSLDAKGMFSHPTEDYDFVIHLHPSVVTRYTQNMFADRAIWGGTGKKYANLVGELAPSVFGETIRLDFDPVRLFYLELQRAYGDSVVLFYDPLGGTSIGGVWNPMLDSERPFRVLLGFSSQPVAENGVQSNKKFHVTLNKSGIIAEIERLGTGLISKIVTSSSS